MGIRMRTPKGIPVGIPMGMPMGVPMGYRMAVHLGNMGYLSVIDYLNML